MVNYLYFKSLICLTGSETTLRQRETVSLVSPQSHYP